MLLSVIIPFYHVEAYIGACLDRVAQLPAQDCEVLLVDDCGSDSSAQIAASYVSRYANFRVIRREKNGGLSAARNTGLQEAQGEYVYFLDSDDLLEPQALMNMIEAAKAQELDVVKGRFAFFDDETGARTPGPQITARGVETGCTLFARQCFADEYEPMVWQCAYRLSFLREHALKMAEGLLFEDELFQAPALFAAARAAVVEENVLLYRQRAGSIMKSFARSAKWCPSYLEVCRRLHALAACGGEKEAVRALRRRVGQIALSVAKNITAYGLEGDVAAAAMAYVRENKKELTGYAISSGDALVQVQGWLLKCSLTLFLKLYARA